MFYYIYKTTNLVNGKYYIGKHQTNNLDDNYLGSGKLLTRAIKKYGRLSFERTILHIFQSEWQMNLAEKILVVPDKEVNYNLCPGGQGGFGYINSLPVSEELFLKRKENLWKASKIRADQLRGTRYKNKKLSEFYKNRDNYNFGLGTKGKSFKKKKGSSSGIKNSQFGTMWITNGIENKKIKKEQEIPQGFRKGMIVKMFT